MALKFLCHVGTVLFALSNISHLMSLGEDGLDQRGLSNYTRIVILSTPAFLQGLPGSPGFKTPCFHGRGLGLILGWGTKIPHATWHGQQQTNIRNNKQTSLLSSHECSHSSLVSK